EAVVGALAVVNAIGDVVGDDGRGLAGSTGPPGAPPLPRPPPFVGGGHTTLGVRATGARPPKLGCHPVAQTAHPATRRPLYPPPPRFDGDVSFVVATGAAGAHFDRLRVAVGDAVVDAIRDAVA